jgi:cob(I)alamin adenosyltransferase
MIKKEEESREELERINQGIVEKKEDLLTKQEALKIREERISEYQERITDLQKKKEVLSYRTWEMRQ